MGTEEIKQELSRFKGVGPKTISCVLMFQMRRNEFPVDTHGEWCLLRPESTPTADLISITPTPHGIGNIHQYGT